MGKGPDFVGVGPTRSGTTWLHQVFANSSSVWVPPIKEIGYWNVVDPGLEDPSLRWRRHFGLRARSTAAALPLLGRLANHPARPAPKFDLRYFGGPMSPAWYRRMFDAAPRGLVAGEVNPIYWRMSHEGVGHFRSELPDVKVIYFMRDPADRIWSAATKRVARDKGRAVAEVPESEWLDWMEHKHRFGLMESLGRWRAAYDPNQLHLAWMDELKHDPVGYLRKILEYIGSEEDPAPLVARVPTRFDQSSEGRRPPPAVERLIARRVLPDLEALVAEPDSPSWVQGWLDNARSAAG